MNVPELLEKLPDDPSKIAAFFRRKGIKGCQRNSRACPVANYLSAAASTPVTVGARDLLWGDYLRYGERLPWSVQEFILRFDNGKYKALIQESE